MFDPNVYAQLNAIDPTAAAQYLATSAATANPAPSPVTPPPAAAPALAQGFAQAAAAPQQAAARGTLEDFFNQPSGGGGPSVTSKFFNQNNRPQGSWLQLTVLADVTNTDVQHQKTPQGVLQYFKKNGQDDLTRPKLVLVVKVQVTGSSDGTHTQVFPDGLASLWLKKGPVTDNLVRAMTAAGDPSGYPKAGAQMVMQSAGEQASRTVGFSATKLYDFQYAAPVHTQEELQAIAQAASGFPTVTAAVPSIAPATSVPPVTAAPAVPAAPVPPAPSATAAPAAAAVPSPTPPTAPPVISTPTAAPAAALPLPTAATPAVPVPEVPTIAAPALAATTGASVPPVPAANFTPPPVPDDPKAAERAALLAKLQGLNA